MAAGDTADRTEIRGPGHCRFLSPMFFMTVSARIRSVKMALLISRTPTLPCSACLSLTRQARGAQAASLAGEEHTRLEGGFTLTKPEEGGADGGLFLQPWPPGWSLPRNSMGPQCPLVAGLGHSGQLKPHAAWEGGPGTLVLLRAGCVHSSRHLQRSSVYGEAGRRAGSRVELSVALQRGTPGLGRAAAAPGFCF